MDDIYAFGERGWVRVHGLALLYSRTVQTERMYQVSEMYVCLETVSHESVTEPHGGALSRASCVLSLSSWPSLWGERETSMCMRLCV